MIINHTITIHKLLYVTEVEGPGKRFCMWVQGCSVRCKGCAVPFTWNANNGIVMDLDALLQRVKESIKKHNITGITVLGGEPFDQADALKPFLEQVKALQLNVLVFSGYYYEQLLARGVDPAIFDVIDLLIEGPFEQHLLDLSRPWVGSSNQKYRFLTDCWDASILTMHTNKVEVRLRDDGTIDVNGMLDSQHIEALQQMIDAVKQRQC